MNTEIWKPIEISDGFYEVSNFGNVRSVTHKDSMGRTWQGKEIVKTLDGAGHYLQAVIKVKGKFKRKNVHRLVAMAFIPNPNNYAEVNHKDENKLNNSADNLEWCTHQYNNTYGSRLHSTRGEKNPQNKIDIETIREIKKNYKHRDPRYGVTPLAKRYGISITHVCSIVHGRRWTYI